MLVAANGEKLYGSCCNLDFQTRAEPPCRGCPLSGPRRGGLRAGQRAARCASQATRSPTRHPSLRALSLIGSGTALDR